jgi:hypothetical protein
MCAIVAKLSKGTGGVDEDGDNLTFAPNSEV